MRTNQSYIRAKTNKVRGFTKGLYYKIERFGIKAGTDTINVFKMDYVLNDRSDKVPADYLLRSKDKFQEYELVEGEYKEIDRSPANTSGLKQNKGAVK